MPDPTHPFGTPKSQPMRPAEDVQVAVGHVVAYVQRMKAKGWRLDCKGKPLWNAIHRDDRVAMSFSRAGLGFGDRPKSPELYAEASDDNFRRLLKAIKECPGTNRPIKND
jgi:hypothetical protein